MKKFYVVVLTVVFVLSFGLGIIAAPNLQEVKVNIDYCMQMFLNGESFNPVDNVTGMAYRPIIYKDKVYLPVGNVCKALNIAVDYDPVNNVLNMGEKRDYVEVKAGDYKDWYYTGYTKDSDLLYTPSKTFRYGIVKTETRWDMYGAVIYPKGKYSKFRTAMYISDGSAQTITFEFINSDTKELLKSVTLKAGETQDVELDIVGVNSISIVHQGSPKNHRIIIGEPQFK